MTQTDLSGGRLSEEELAEIPCGYCRSIVRAISDISPVTTLRAGANMFIRGHARVLAHTAAGHPES